jgi:hypothetical protein
MSEPEKLVKLRLVPVEVFTGLCDHDDCKNPDHLGYGIADAVEAWSDCNRASGRIYRVDDVDGRYRHEGDTVTIWVNQSDVAWFDRNFGELDGRPKGNTR